MRFFSFLYELEGYALFDFDVFIGTIKATMKILPLQFGDANIRDDQTQRIKDICQDSGNVEFNLHEMFDVFNEDGDQVPDIEGCDLFCPESLSDEADYSVPFSSISSISSQDPEEILGGLVYPQVDIVSPPVFNENEDLNRRISDGELSQSESDAEDIPMEEHAELRRGSEGQSVARRNPAYFDGMFPRNSAQNRDRRVPDLNGSLYDSDEERILYSPCSDSDHVVPEFYMEE